ncbi:shikimate dehydrogenase [Alphaproteobacteria bacterium]|nr:shikimate dehydrogenase [Alphaproteobacteria bacterium]
MIKTAYVIGSNTKKSLSPYIFKYWFKKYQIDGRYLYKQIKPEKFQEEIKKILNQKNLCGFNVTIPYKETIKNKIDTIDYHAKKIGAVNFVSKENNKWVGKNTDWTGFLNSINSIFKENEGLKATIIGYGGASKSIIYALKKKGFKEINIYNRSPKKIKKLINKKGINIIDLKDISLAIDRSSIVVNTVPIDLVSPLLSKQNKKNIFAYDLVYRPKETGFLSNFKKNKRLYGISMLVHQAAPCFEAWFGVKPIIDEEIFIFLYKNYLK